KIEVPGTLMPFETTEIRPEISGRLVSLNIPEGRFVNKGTVLAKIFDGDLQAQLRKLQVQLSIAEKTAERYNELLKISGISQQEYDLAELQSNNLRADIQLVQVDINRTQVRAPYSGQVGLKNISLGAYVSPTTLITTISQVNRLKLEFTVPEKYSEDMKPGKSISFSVTGSTKQFTAAVMATETTIEANTRSLRVRAVVNQNDAVLASGAFAKVSLNLDKNNEAIIIPTQAVIPQARNKRVIMYKNGSPEFIVVTTGIRDSTFVEITDGLKAGDTVVITGLLAIRPESKITLSKVQ
ncbi:MAG: efflux RND transporter periplasmic adaptor subunit, partial [Flavitalea sp.]